MLHLVAFLLLWAGLPNSVVSLLTAGDQPTLRCSVCSCVSCACDPCLCGVCNVEDEDEVVAVGDTVEQTCWVPYGNNNCCLVCNCGGNLQFLEEPIVIEERGRGTRDHRVRLRFRFRAREIGRAHIDVHHFRDFNKRPERIIHKNVRVRSRTPSMRRR